MSSKKGPYLGATKEEWMRPVEVKGDSRQWFYTDKCMYKGEMHARVVGYGLIPGIPSHSASKMFKKLVPMRKVKFLCEEKEISGS